MFSQYRESSSLALNISTTLFVSYNALSNLLKTLIKGVQGQTWNGPLQIATWYKSVMLIVLTGSFKPNRSQWLLK